MKQIKTESKAPEEETKEEEEMETELKRMVDMKRSQEQFETYFLKKVKY